MALQEHIWGRLIRCFAPLLAGFALAAVVPMGWAGEGRGHAPVLADGSQLSKIVSPSLVGVGVPTAASHTEGKLEMRIQLEGPSFEVGQPITISMILSNSTDRLLMYKFMHPEELGFRLVVTDEHGQPVQRRAEVGATNEFERNLHRNQHHLTSLGVDPGGISVVTFPFSSKYCLDKAGTYTVVGSVQAWETNANPLGWIAAEPLVFRLGDTNAVSRTNRTRASSQASPPNWVPIQSTGLVSNTEARPPMPATTAGNDREEPENNKGVLGPLLAICGIGVCVTLIWLATSRRLPKPR